MNYILKAFHVEKNSSAPSSNHLDVDKKLLPPVLAVDGVASIPKMKISRMLLNKYQDWQTRPSLKK